MARAGDGAIQAALARKTTPRSGHAHRRAPVAVAEEDLENLDRDRRREEGEDGLHARLEVGELHEGVLHVVVRRRLDLRERGVARDEDEQVQRRRVLHRDPQVSRVLGEGVHGHVVARDLAQEEDGERERGEEEREQLVVLRDREAPRPAVHQVDGAARRVRLRAVDEQRLHDAREHGRREAQHLPRAEDDAALVGALELAELDRVAVGGHVREHHARLRGDRHAEPRADRARVADDAEQRGERDRADPPRDHVRAPPRAARAVAVGEDGVEDLEPPREEDHRLRVVAHVGVAAVVVEAEVGREALDAVAEADRRVVAVQPDVVEAVHLLGHGRRAVEHARVPPQAARAVDRARDPPVLLERALARGRVEHGLAVGAEQAVVQRARRAAALGEPGLAVHRRRRQRDALHAIPLHDIARVEARTAGAAADQGHEGRGESHVRDCKFNHSHRHEQFLQFLRHRISPMNPVV